MRFVRPALLIVALWGLLLPSLAAAQSAACALPGRDGPTYVRNTYYPGSGTASAAGRTLNLGTLRGGTDAASAPLTPGDLVFIIQMQDGVLNNSNSVAYGNGSTGRGVTDLRGAGRYEFGVVTAVSGSVVTLRDPLRYTYESSPATASAVRRSFQVLRVPQHSALTLGGTVRPPAWNGETGGVVVFDVAGTLNLGGATVDVSAAGYRGGGSFVGGSLTGQNIQDYAALYTTTTSRGAMKAEGYAGTPTLVRGTAVTGGYTGTPSGLAAGDLGYPGGLTVARGAPGNAGGGGTQHSAGGGVIFIRAGGVTGSGTLLANGQAGEPGGRDAGGGGGAGGTVALDIPAGAVSGLNVQVRGGAGGTSGLPLRAGETQGPGAGGGGGAVLLAQGVTVGSADVSGGAAGLNSPAAGLSNSYGSRAGAGGNGQLVYANDTAPLPGLCTPALTVTKTTATPTRFTTSTAATYTITVSNAARRSEATDVTVQDPALPAGFTFARTQAVTLDGGATRTVVTDPTPGSAAPAWGTFTLPAGASVSVTFDVTLASPAPATYQNAAQASYLDPARTSAAGTATATFDPLGSGAEDVTVFSPPRVPLQKWVRNVTRATPFGTQGGGQPGDILEYCIAFRNDGGYVATNFTLRDTIPANSLALPAAYGTSPAPEGAPLGVRLSAQPVQAGESTPAGTDLTAAADADAASLSASGLTYATNLAAGAGGSVCFRTQVR